MQLSLGELTGRVALVTGATGDVGTAIVEALAGAGARVHAVGRRAERLAGLTAATPHALDLVPVEQLGPAIAALGPIDILVLGAAHAPERKALLDQGLADMRAVFETNYFATVTLLQALLPGMCERGWGRVIHLSSLAASIGESQGPGYCASKAAVDGLLRNLAIDYSPKGITFNVLELGPVDSERFRGWGATKARRFAQAAAVRRVGVPEDAAHAVLFLASPGAGYVTGTTLAVDGGLGLGNPTAAMYVRESGKAE